MGRRSVAGRNLDGRARILRCDACIAAPLALGFDSDDASIRFTLDAPPAPRRLDAAAAVRAAAGPPRGSAVTAFDEQPEARVESPCIRHCTLDDDDICLGCFRSIDEICAWGGAGNTERREILACAAARRDSRAGNRD